MLDFMINFREKTPEKNFKLLKCEHIIYSFEACDLEISNKYVITFAKYLNFAIF